MDHPQFVPELARLHFEEWGYLNPQETLDERAQRLTGFVGRGGVPTALVAMTDEELVGSALLVAHDMRTRTDLSPWLAGVYVKPAYRQRGVASSLVARVEAEAIALSVPCLYLYTPSEAPFYARRGWQTLEQTEYRGVAVTVMRKTMVTPTV